MAKLLADICILSFFHLIKKSLLLVLKKYIVIMTTTISCILL